MPHPTLRDYQVTDIEELKELMKVHYSSVLSTCAGGGKTLMGLHLAQPYLDRGEYVLVLAHGTTVLRSQWHQDVKEMGFENEKLIIRIPQSIREIKAEMHGKTIGLLIVDEAHEFYFAKTVQDIIKTLRPKRELLMTATPSRFIYDNLQGGIYRPIQITSGLDIYRAGYLQNTYFGMVKSNYELTDSDSTLVDFDTNSEDDEEGEIRAGAYNSHGMLKRTIKLSTADTKKSLENLMEAMVDRLKMVLGGDKTNIVNFLNRLKLGKAGALFGELRKTMIAANSIPQANDISDILGKLGVSCVLSESMSDQAALNVDRFVEDESIKVLVVVRRGTLGFNMPELCNVVDMTCSRNINLIYQLLSRAVRIHPDGYPKFFFRVTGKIRSNIDSFYLQAALCMNNGDFLSRYNGKNLSRMEILVPKRLRFHDDDGDESGEGGTSRGRHKPDHKVDSLMYNEIMSLDLMNEVSIVGSKAWNEFEYVKTKEVMDKISGKVFGRAESNIRAVQAWILAHGVEVG